MNCLRETRCSFSASPTYLSIQIYREMAPCIAMLFSSLKEAIIFFRQNKMNECLATCWDVCARATRHNSRLNQETHKSILYRLDYVQTGEIV